MTLSKKYHKIKIQDAGKGRDDVRKNKVQYECKLKSGDSVYVALYLGRAFVVRPVRARKEAAWVRENHPSLN